jgi:hypothetical protein
MLHLCYQQMGTKKRTTALATLAARFTARKDEDWLQFCTGAMLAESREEGPAGHVVCYFLLFLSFKILNVLVCFVSGRVMTHSYSDKYIAYSA